MAVESFLEFHKPVLVVAIIMKDYDRVCEMSAHKIYGDDYDLIKKYCQLPKKSIRRRRNEAS